jgi:hypothetical protein
MPRRPALLTQAEVARSIRAAKAAGAAAVEIKRDGAIIVHLFPQPTQATGEEPNGVDAERIVPL